LPVDVFDSYAIEFASVRALREHLAEGLITQAVDRVLSASLRDTREIL
jgi:hypothetical protein